MAALACLVVFFLVISVTYDGTGEHSWPVALVAAIGTGVSMLMFREIVIRRIRAREFAARRLSHHIRIAGTQRQPTPAKKLTIEKNIELVAEIRKRSDAAKILSSVADAHKDIFELCERYLDIASTEIARARVGSPRLPAIRKGAAIVARRHKYHILKWAEIRARSAGLDNDSMILKERIGSAEGALAAVDRAIEFYPGESQLTESRRVLLAFLASGRVKGIIGDAELAESLGNVTKAVGLYKKAIDDLMGAQGGLAERNLVRERIEMKIRRLEAEHRR